MTNRGPGCRVRALLAGLALAMLAGCAAVGTVKPGAPTASAASPRIVSAAQDPKVGPCVQTTRGCIALNPDVTDQNLHQTVCVAGYTRSVRPASSYTQGVKAKLMREQGIDPSRMSDFELDHIVPLALGGHPRRLSNLMLQPWDGPQGAHMKDILEARLQRLVCQDKVGLAEAQACIATDWEACAARYRR